MQELGVNNGFGSTQVVKRSDKIANDIKRYIVQNKLKQGDKLPNEKQLCEIFACAKGTVREALKSLEVQGLVAIKTGPSGGPTLIEVSFDRITSLLRNFLQFQDLNVEQIYAVRKLIEVDLAVSVVGLIPKEILAKLKDQVGSCCAPKDDQSIKHQHIDLREKELDFHDVIADYCPNPLLAFHAKFINELLRNFIDFRYDHISQYEAFTQSNIDFHRLLILAFEDENIEKVEALMKQHMDECEKHTLSLNAKLSEALMLNK